MKGNYFISLVEMDSTARQQLVTEVKETLATNVDFANNEKASFKTVDLWKMEKNKKSATRTFSRKRNEIPFI
jgi:serine protease inhibitor